MAHISRLDPYAPTAPTSLASARAYLEENRGVVSTLILWTGDVALVFTRVRDWGYFEAEEMAKYWGHDNFGWLNLDESNGAGVMTGRGVFAPVARRQLAVVA